MLRRLTLAVLTLLAGALVAGAPAAPAASCLNPMPTSEVTTGMTLLGLTVTEGKTPGPFTAKVMGVLKDGIAPGVDMIIVEAHSAAIDKAGIWAGISGSPVYADSDDRLVGSMSYGLSLAPSNIGGLAAAEDLEKVAQLPALPPAAPRTVKLPKALQAKIVARGDATASELAGGLQQLRLPLAVSGLRGSRLGAFAGRLGGAERYMPYGAGKIAASPGDIADIVPGSNFAAAISYGDVSAAGLGTTTGVCGDTVVAFGHPMNFDGPSALSAHTAEAIGIQDDQTLGSYKLGNIGGVVGTLDQDRLSGIRAILGTAPTPIHVTSAVDDGAGASRTGLTEVNGTLFTPDVAAFHLVSNIDRVIDRIGGGTASLGWTVTGIAGGENFSFSRNNRFADPADVSFSSSDELFSDLLTVVDNPFTDVKLTGVSMNATVKSPFRQYRITGLQQFKDGRWAAVGDTDTIELTPGTALRVRVLLANFRSAAPVAPVELRFPVPADATGDGSLDILGGSDSGDGGDSGFAVSDTSGEPGTFKDLLAALRDAPRNDEVTGTLSLFGSGDGEPGLLDGTSSSPAPASVTKRLAEVVTGALSVSVVVAGSDEPPHPSEPPTVALGGKSTLKLRTALRKGLRITVTSSAPGRLVARAFVDKKTARRLKIKKNATGPVVVASVTRIIGDGRSHVALKFTRKAKKRLAHAKRVRLTLRATVTDLDGNRGADHRKLVLKRKLR